jgi:hypothetical protein
MTPGLTLEDPSRSVPSTCRDLEALRPAGAVRTLERYHGAPATRISEDSMPRSISCLALAALVLGCRSSAPNASMNLDTRARTALLDTVKSLEGTWETAPVEGQKHVTEFHVSSRGSAVREIMDPQGDHEMTNMYHLDGNSLVLTHYCAAGNQPRMVATEKKGNTIAFRLDSVSDLKAPEELFMGEMTLEVLDRDHIAQHWRSFRGDQVDHEIHFAYTRRK